MDLYTKLSSCMEELSSTFTSRMVQYEEDLRNAAGTDTAHKTIAGLSRDFTDFKALIWKTMGMMKSQIELLLTGLDRHEMGSRRKVLLLHGLDETTETTCVNQTVSIIKDKLQLPHITVNDLEYCHRLGTNLSKPRPLLIRFQSYMRRTEVWSTKTRLKGTGLTLSEFLTKPRHDVFMDARKHFGVRQCWTSDGKIVVQLPNNKRRKIETSPELRKLCMEFPATQLPPPGISKTSQPVAGAAASIVTVSEKRLRKQVK